MRHAPLVALALLVSVAEAGAQAVASHQKSFAPSTARYEFMQSDLTASSTFRLDRITGEVGRLVMRSDSSLTFDILRRQRHPAGSPQDAGQVNYQLFLSGLANRHTYLINLNNGATWQLVLTPDEELVWDPIQ